MRKFIFIAATISICNAAIAQNCSDKGRTILMYPLDIPILMDMNSGSDKEKNKKLSDQQEMMWSIAKEIKFPVYGAEMVFGAQAVSQIGKNFPPSIDYLQDPGLYPPLPAEAHSEYFLSGSIEYNEADNFIIHYELKTSCSKKLVHAVDVSFHLPATDNPILFFAESVADELIKKMGSLQNHIHNFEQKQMKEDDKVIMENIVMLTPLKKTLANGESTEVTLDAKKCDGTPIKNFEFTFQGTTGGIANPSKVITDIDGKAKFKFTKGHTPIAVLSANCIAKYPWGCNNDLTGSTAFSKMIKVEINYSENVTTSLKRMTLPGVAIEGGEETEIRNAAHTAVFYHYPSASALKDGFILDVDGENSDEKSKTVNIIHKGFFKYQKGINDAKIKSKAGNITMVDVKEEGSTETYSAISSPKHHSSVMFRKRMGYDSAQFIWNVIYLAETGGEIFEVPVSMVINENDEGVKWIVKNVKDPKSPYKTEYLIKVKLDAAEELQKGNKTLKDLFGFNIDELSSSIDPTKPKKDMVTATGSKTLNVRILSPYLNE